MTPSVCALVLLSVGTIGPLADLFHKKPIVPAYEIQKLQCHPKWRDRDNAAAALGRCDWRRNPEIVEALAAALVHDPDEDVRGEAAESLAKLAPCMPVAIEAARRAANCDEDHGVRKWARKALANMERNCRTPCRYCRDEAGPPIIIREGEPTIIHEGEIGHSHEPHPTMLNVPRPLPDPQPSIFPPPPPQPQPRSAPLPLPLPRRDSPQGIWPADEPAPATDPNPPAPPQPSLEPPVTVPPPPGAPTPNLEPPAPNSNVEPPALPPDSSLGILEPLRPRRAPAASIASRPARPMIAPASAAQAPREIISEPATRPETSKASESPNRPRLIIPQPPAPIPAPIRTPDESESPVLEPPKSSSN